MAPMISTASRTTASLSDAKNRKTGLRCQRGREVEEGGAMVVTAIFREKLGWFNARVVLSYSCSCS